MEEIYYSLDITYSNLVNNMNILEKKDELVKETLISNKSEDYIANNSISSDLVSVQLDLSNDPDWFKKVDILKIDPDSLTLKQRKEWKQKKYELEKQQRYEEYLIKDSSISASSSNDSCRVNSGELSKEQKTGSVRLRFEQAKKEQQEREENRLAAIKNQKGVIVTPSSFSNTRSAWKDGELFSNPSPFNNSCEISNNISPANFETKGKLRNLWQSALDNTKTSEQVRYENTKQATIAEFRVTDGSGMVKKRIDEWEELVLQIQASAEMLAEFVRHAQMVSMRVAEKVNDSSGTQKFRFSNKDNISEDSTANEWWNIETKSHAELLRIRDEFLNDCLLPELFVLNDTHIYSLQVLEASIRSSLRRSLNEAKIDHIALRCGVYSSQSFNGLAPIDVFAALICTSQGKEYISVSIKANEEFLPADGRLRPAQKELLKEIYGVYKIIISINNSNNNENIIEKLIKVVPMPGWETLIEGYLGPIAVDEEEDKKNENESKIVGEILFFDDEDLTIELKKEDNENQDESKQNIEEISLFNQENLNDIEIEQKNNEENTEESREVDNIEIRENIEEEKKLDLDESRDSYASSNGSFDHNGVWIEKITPPPVNRYNGIASIFNSQSNEDDEINDMSPMGDFSDNEEDADLSDEEENEVEMMNNLKDEKQIFSEDMSLPSISNSKSFLPENEILNEEDSQLKKFSWNLEDERSENFPKATHSNLYLNISSVLNSQSSYSTFIIQNPDSAMLFTGTLKYATTSSFYMIVNGDKVFEYIRGAASSGWLIKYPMKSQKFGRQRTRYFVLRDHVLSYHVQKPPNEQHIMMDRFSRNTVHITPDSTISIGRKFLSKCLTITTPLDTLWIKLQRDLTRDIVKWMSELNNSIQYLQRPRFFATKPRIESKWYHESPFFTLRYMDSVISNQPISNTFLSSYDDKEQVCINERFCKVALFSLRIPIDISIDITDDSRSQMNDTIEYKEIRHSIDISNSECARLQMDILNENEKSFTFCDLNIVKIYGDIVLLGGNKGFLGYGIISRTSTKKNPTKNSEENIGLNNSIMRKVLFCIPCDDVLRDPEEETNEDVKELFSASVGIPYPHAEDSKITAIGISEKSSIFVSADDQGIISLWHLPRNKDICSLSPTTATISSSSWRKVAERLKPECLAAVNINVINFSSNTNPSVINFSDNSIGHEIITSLKFCCHDSYLIVSTNRRLLLFSMQFTNTFTDKYTFYDSSSTNRARSSSICSISNFGTNKHLSFGSSGSGSPFNLNSAGNSCVTGFNGYVLLDKAIPGQLAIFDMYIEEDESGSLPQSIIQWKILESDEIETKKTQSSWFSNSENTIKTNSGLSKCTVSRIEWSLDMFQTALEKLKPFPIFM